jgi:pimeloyl-ACP methyl ester carboxylesterase
MLEAFRDALGLAEFDLVANDTGGALAQGLAVRDPGRIRTLTLTNCEARDWMPSKSELAQLVGSLAEKGELAQVLKSNYDDRDAARQGAFAATIQWPDRISDDELRGIMEPHQATLEGAKRLERFATSLSPEQLMAIEPQLRELQVPTIAVWGDADPVFPLELAHWLRDTIPGMRDVVEIEDGLLFWPWERGDELVPHLRRHWQSATSQVA